MKKNKKSHLVGEPKNTVIYLFKITMILLIMNNLFSCKTISSYHSKHLNRFGLILESGFRFNIADTNLIIQKAKLMTIPSFGIMNPDTLINRVLTQKYHYIYVITDGLAFIIIDPYNYSITDTSDCYYTLIYSYAYKRFYRISGFNQNDYKSFYKDYKSVLPIDFEIGVSKESDKQLIKKIFDEDCLKKKYIRRLFWYRNRDCACKCE